MEKTTLLKGDYIIIASVVALALIIFCLTLGSFSSQGDIVEVHLNNKLLYSLPINKEETILIDDIFQNTIIIENNTVRVTQSTCPDGICENFGSISRGNESIICMPNRLIITIISDSDNIDEIDIIV